MMAQREACTLILAVVLAACSTQSEDETVESAARPCPARPLTEYCSNNQCPDYETAVLNTRRHAATAGPRPCVALIGTCGGLRYTFTGTGFVGTGLFFDSAGHLVAVEESTDAIPPNDSCHGSTFYGLAVRCVPEVLEHPCSAR